jgi:pimeloyl-ACP methyl ester carboxylesterase
MQNAVFSRNKGRILPKTKPSTGYANSTGGKALGYRKLGSGPGVLVVHGAMSSGYNHMQMAEAMADEFSVYLVDRRGRGLSGPLGKADNLDTEVEDIDALLSQTGAHFIFGLSSGAIICLESALKLPAVHKAAIFEPPLFVGDLRTPSTALLRFDDEMANGDVAAALVTAMKASQMGPRVLNFVPRRLLEWLVNLLLKAEAKKPPAGYEPTRTLAATMHHDMQLVVDMAGDIHRFEAIGRKVLLLGGSKSPAFLKRDLDELQAKLPGAQRVELAKLGHAASWNSDRGGDPEPVAAELKRFFASRHEKP